MLHQQKGRNRGDICAPTSQRQRLCLAFQMPNAPNLRRRFPGEEAGCGDDGKVPMAQFMNGITDTAPSRNTTVTESIKASFVPMALQ